VSFRTLVERLLQLIPVLLGAALVVFLMTTLTPGDPVEIMVGNDEHITPEQIETLRRDMGLHLPLHQRFFLFLGNAITGNFGLSFFHRRPVADVLLERMPATIELALVGILVALLIAIPTGVIAAVRRGSIFDRIATTIAVAGVAMPNFWLGILLIMLFAVELGWLPVAGRLPSAIDIHRGTGFLLIDSLLWGPSGSFRAVLSHLVLPAITIGTGMSALLMRVTRSSMIETLQQDYVAFATAKGLAPSRVLIRHALRNALIPVVTVAALDIGSLLSGAIITETVFAWPGVGRVLIEGITARNYPLVQAGVLMFALIYIAANFVADLLYVVLHPRIRL
jgi:ABC-type dipeptide/oligopeptide/nickel transport system permease component